VVATLDDLSLHSLPQLPLVHFTVAILADASAEQLYN